MHKLQDDGGLVGGVQPSLATEGGVFECANPLRSSSQEVSGDRVRRRYVG